MCVCVALRSCLIKFIFNSVRCLRFQNLTGEEKAKLRLLEVHCESCLAFTCRQLMLWQLFVLYFWRSSRLIAIDWRNLAWVDEMVHKARPERSESSCCLWLVCPILGCVGFTSLTKALPLDISLFSLEVVLNCTLHFFSAVVSVKVVATFSELPDSLTVLTHTSGFTLELKIPVNLFFTAVKLRKQNYL